MKPLSRAKIWNRANNVDAAVLNPEIGDAAFIVMQLACDVRIDPMASLQVDNVAQEHLGFDNVVSGQVDVVNFPTHQRFQS